MFGEDVKVVLAQETTQSAVNEDVSDVRADDVTRSNAFPTCVTMGDDSRIRHSQSCENITSEYYTI